ncbi:MAG: gamma-glutamyltransferase, partial [Planctomycetes bacterium]|nr:gamma-glutamyltransferase [Planctomycetota bacterium]
RARNHSDKQVRSGARAGPCHRAAPLGRLIRSSIFSQTLRRYAPLWEEPLRASYGENDICTLGPTEIGAVELVETMNLLDLARQRQLPHFTKSADALYQFIRICRYGHLISWKHPVPDGDPEWSPEKRVTKEAAARAWERMKKPGWETELAEQMAGGAGHSDGIVVADARGNVAALVHSINTTSWGNTGLFVDGVSIPDSACFQQERVARTGPGRRFPNITNPAIVLRDGRPVLAAACIGAALHECMPQNLVNVLDYGMDPKAAVETPNFWGPAWGGDPADWWRQAVGKGEFAEGVLRGVEKLGQPVKEVPAAEISDRISYWIGMTIDGGGTRRGAVNWKINGIVEGR